MAAMSTHTAIPNSKRILITRSSRIWNEQEPEARGRRVVQPMLRSEFSAGLDPHPEFLPLAARPKNSQIPLLKRINTAPGISLCQQKIHGSGLPVHRPTGSDSAFVQNRNAGWGHFSS